jgi:hypothetical protein
MPLLELASGSCFAIEQHRLSAITQAVLFVKSGCSIQEIPLKVCAWCDGLKISHWL